MFQRSNVVLVGSLASVATATYKTLDNFITHKLITAADSLTAAFAQLILNGWIGVCASIFFSLIFGKKLIDPQFSKLKINNLKMHRQALISGGISAGSTLFLLLGNQLGDPSVMIALANLTVVYTLLYDILKRQIEPQRIFLPASLTVIGGMMAAYNGSLSITALGIFYIVVVSNGLTAASQISEQQGVRCSDSVNFFVWRFFWLAMTATILAVVVCFINGYLALLFETVKSGVIYLPWIVVTMFFVFLGVGLKLYLQKTQAVSFVLLILSTQLVLAYPITFFSNAFQPGIFGNIPSHPLVWIIRILGAALIVLGISQISRNKQPKFY